MGCWALGVQMDSSEFRRHGHSLVDWIADYLANSERYPVLSRVSPGDIRGQLPAAAPDEGEPFDEVLRDFERVIVPGLTHWNHPGFFAYFAITASAPGVLAELLSAALNQQAMLWRTSPSATELEEVTLAWLRQLLGLPDAFEGVIYDTASISTLHALAAARESVLAGVREHGLAGRTGLGRGAVYCSEQAHSSIDKAVMLLGLGHDMLRRIPVDAGFRMRPDLLAAAIAADRATGIEPVAVVATIGTTSTTSVDPMAAIAAICGREAVWLHVDAAYAGAAALLADHRHHFDGWELADSVVINPHKWLFVPFDLSAFYCRRMDVVRQTFSLVPEYLRTTDAERARNLMDTGIQLGRRFRALKLWMVLRHYGAKGLRAALAEHVRLARLFASLVESDSRFELAAPVPFSVVCFRARVFGPRRSPGQDRREPRPARPVDEVDDLNRRLLDAVNASGEVFLSHTDLNGVFVLRLAIGHIRTEEAHVARAWALIQHHMDQLPSS
jgi:aromatic-L-amino-acid decarboxylase